MPFLSWHHLEEMLVVDEPGNASARGSFLQSLPMIAWMQAPRELGLGGIVHILAAEAMAFDAGCRTLREIRDDVRSRLLRTGVGSDAIGLDDWVWDEVRRVMRDRRPHLGMVSALLGLKSMDDRLTVGALSGQIIRPPEERRLKLAEIHRGAFERAKATDARRSDDEARAMADNFLRRVQANLPGSDVSIRQFLVETYVRAGLGEHEVRDDCTIAELSELATFRTQLRTVAGETGLSYERLRLIGMDRLPSWRIADALKRHGQERRLKPGSDVHDRHLAVLAAYADEIFVDKRTHEDLRRVAGKERELAGLFGIVRKASAYAGIAETA